MTDIVYRGISVIADIPAEIHGAIAHPLAEHVPAKIRPDAVTALEADPNHGLVRAINLGELQTNTDVLPLGEGIPNALVQGIYTDW